MKKYAAIRGDRTSSGAKLLGEGVSKVEDVDGIMMPYCLENEAFTCPKCNTIGHLVSSGGLGWPDNGRRIILDGDIAACACNPKPRVIANRQYLSSIEVEDKVQAALVFDEQFILKNSSGIPMENIYYTIKKHTGKFLHGVTDANGKTERIATDGIELLEVYIGHLEEF